MGKRGRILAAGSAVALVLSGCAQPVQDLLDRAALRSLFGLPIGADLVQYDGYSARVGFGQREGLRLRAVYDLSPAEATSFLERALDQAWEPLPIESDLLSRVPCGELPVPLDLTQGLYLCRTAGDEVLHPASTQDCLDVQRMNDLILGVYDSQERRVWVSVQAGY